MNGSTVCSRPPLRPRSWRGPSCLLVFGPVGSGLPLCIVRDGFMGCAEVSESSTLTCRWKKKTDFASNAIKAERLSLMDSRMGKIGIYLFRWHSRCLQKSTLSYTPPLFWPDLLGRRFGGRSFTRVVPAQERGDRGVCFVGKRRSVRKW